MIPVNKVDWPSACRIVPSKFPPESLFDRVANAEDFNALYALESMTNDRLRDEIGAIQLVKSEDKVFGQGTTPIMAAFTHPNPNGSRFSNGAFGVYYAALSKETAIAEVSHHMGLFYQATNSPAATESMRIYFSGISGDLHDVRGMKDGLAGIYDENNYAASQFFGYDLWEKDSWGICYDSVRDKGGECVAIFRPPVIQPVIQGPHLFIHWDGSRISHVSAT